jgi:putative Mn2+ efflux pump MntP
MPMKISLALGDPRALSRQTAWGCLTTNLAMPGFGSLIGGRRVGYIQAGIYLVSFIVTMVLGVRFIYWALQNWNWLHGEEGDRLEALAAMWKVARWPLAGILGFVVSWLWALGTSLSIINSVPKTGSSASAVPPKL